MTWGMGYQITILTSMVQTDMFGTVLTNEHDLTELADRVAVQAVKHAAEQPPLHYKPIPKHRGNNSTICTHSSRHGNSANNIRQRNKQLPLTNAVRGSLCIQKHSGVPTEYLVAYLRAEISNQPTRRGRPVVVPYSRPTSRKVSAASPKSSVGYGPAPTLVVYAFACIAQGTIMPVVEQHWLP